MESDSEESISRYLKRNLNLSFVYYKDNKIIGSILCGHDGRRGYIHHTCVLPEYRGQSIGRSLVEKSLEELKNQGIDKCFSLPSLILQKQHIYNMGIITLCVCLSCPITTNPLHNIFLIYNFIPLI